jgi:hypothetical protein
MKYCKPCTRFTRIGPLGIEQRVVILFLDKEKEPPLWTCPDCGSIDEDETLTADDIREDEERSRYWARRPGFQCEPGGDPI